jgi:hypothetical protein
VTSYSEANCRNQAITLIENRRSINESYRDFTPTIAASSEAVSYGHGIGAVAVTIFANGNEPVVGAFGSEGARVLTGK